jgi:hypothetical protein
MVERSIGNGKGQNKSIFIEKKDKGVENEELKKKTKFMKS